MNNLSPPRTTWVLQPKSFGFTVTELLTVVLILSVLAMVALPSFAKAMGRVRIKSAAEAIASDLDLARLETAKRNADLRVSFRTGGNWCYGIDTAPCDCSVAGQCAIKRVGATDIGRGVTMGSVAFGGNNFTSFSRVRGTAAAGQVNLQADTGARLRVVVSTRGRVRICSPADIIPGYPSC